MPASDYPHLFQPIRVGHLSLRNRVIMGSMHTGLEDVAQGFARLAQLYAERAAQGVDLIVTGGIGPNPEALGRPAVAAYSCLYTPEQIPQHQQLTQAVHTHGSHILMQIVHVGRYDHDSGGISPSSLISKLSNRSSRELSHAQIEALIADYVQCAQLAQQAGYDGVEIMGGEGYLINQFLAPITNFRVDQWGNDVTGRAQFALRIVRGIRAAVGSNFVLSFRLSLMDLVQHGSSSEEVIQQAQMLEAAGIDLFNTSVGWHEARVPTVAMMVPRGAFSWAVKKLRAAVSVPVSASNRISTPDVAEGILARGEADLVTMARPFLADPAWVHKTQQGQAHAINTCIGCNQSCMDHVFLGHPLSCLSNPRTGHEWSWPLSRATATRHIAVLGSGPAGLACAREAALRGHRVTVFESARQVGGQLLLAQTIPGKQEFAETLRYYQLELQRLGVQVHVRTRPTDDDLRSFDHVVVATGTAPRRSHIPGEHSAKVIDYLEALRQPNALGERVAIVGGGPISFDMAELLSHVHQPAQEPIAAFLQEWGVDPLQQHRGGLCEAQPPASAREIWLLQRNPQRPGQTLGATTRWIHRTRLQKKSIRIFNEVDYLQIDDAGLHLRIRGVQRCLSVDHIVMCTGQEPHNPWGARLAGQGIAHTVIGGARSTQGLNAASAFREGAELGRSL